jgi:DNA invertase Pin-like site-specific DNA recombinase
MFSMMGVFAEFERSMIQERVKAGLERAKAEGKRLGRPPVLTSNVKDEARALRAKGLSARQVAKRTGVSHTSVLRLDA